MEFARSRHVAASPERIWPFVDDVTRWKDWFNEAEDAELLSGEGLGRRQRMRGHARGRTTEIDSSVTQYEPPHVLRWHHDEERVDGKPAPVVYARDAVAEVRIEPDGSGSRVTYRLVADPGNPLYFLLLRFAARGPINRSFQESLDRLAALAESEIL